MGQIDGVHSLLSAFSYPISAHYSTVDIGTAECVHELHCLHLVCLVVHVLCVVRDAVVACYIVCDVDTSVDYWHVPLLRERLGMGRSEVVVHFVTGVRRQETWE